MQKKILVVAKGISGGGAEQFLKNTLNTHIQANYFTTVCTSEAVDHLKEIYKQEQVVFKKIHTLQSLNRYRFIKWGNKKKHIPFSKQFFILLEFLQIGLRSFKHQLILVSNINPAMQFELFLLPKPVILMVHSIPSSYNDTHAFNRWIVNNKVNGSSKNYFTTVSTAAKKSIEKYWKVIPENCLSIPNGIMLPDLVVKKIATRKQILTVGDFVYYKNVHTWFAVAQQCIKVDSTLQFIWVGKGDLLAEYQQKVIDSNLDNNILLPGYSNAISTYYQTAYLYFHPSIFESQGLSIIEAMSYCTPCVAANVGGIPESVIHTETGFLAEVNDVEKYVQYILQLVNDTDLQMVMGLASREKVTQSFSINSNSSLLINLYNKVI